ncbi:MAG: 1-deoxy-D-xylulose-5-phosphate synthase [Clostridium cadaveris]|uniref:1-deoxy-D-xylulose-5-phosphate synthase n=1 Tax=Clostridium cadaveris TaxID=1529 RepID=A0A316M7G0_9CLOT|nr:MAG: 1-deoxy-D-xylulose-5-phosphate synthase [Clostridium cadaveris]
MLEKYKEPKDIKNMSLVELGVLSDDIRKFLIDNISKTGGHLASNLGVVELTISLFNVFNIERDKVIWDVGHQSYVYKMLTGRKDEFNTLRQFQGLSGFPKRNESIYDAFDTGHSSTSISAALGIARARDIFEKDFNVIAVIGDGALTGGMALEALNDLGFNKTKLIIILNDNQMSISQNVGGLSTYLSTMRMDPGYNRFKKEFNNTMRKTSFGKSIVSSINKVKDGIKQIIVPGMLFEDMGIKYLGPIDGHNIKELSRVLKLAKNLNEPVIIHTITKKGKGYEYAEKYPDKFHGVGPFNPCNGENKKSSSETYSSVFGDEMIQIAASNKKVVAITAAMPDGTGLRDFAKKYPNRFFDVGIAEQHAVTLAAGLATQGIKPVFAVYSTFLQRGYDQVLHDVCIQNLPVVFAIDRAGIVGEDGETHQGIFDLSYLTPLPNMTIMAPKCLKDLRLMLNWATKYKDGPVAIRYPRGGEDKNVEFTPLENIDFGKWNILSHGEKVAIIATGKMVTQVLKVKDDLKEKGINPLIIDAYFIKPIDKDLIKYLVDNNYKILTIEDNIVASGLGSQTLAYANSLKKPFIMKNLGYRDRFVPHGDIESLYKLSKLDVESIKKEVIEL